MTRREKLEKRYNSLVYNHLWLKFIIENGLAVLATAFSAFIFAFAVTAFVKPGIQNDTAFASGGSSGLAQVIELIFVACGVNPILFNSISIYSIAFVLINAPLLILAFKGVGKRFAFYTLLNIAFVFLFTNVMRFDFMDEFASQINENGKMIARALFAGVCTGLSSAIAFKIDSSAGGVDIISYYYANKKSTLAGKYGMIVNGFVVVAYALVSGLGFEEGSFASSLESVCYSLVYLLTVMLTVDVINIRNKKAQIQIITTDKNLPKLLLANIPHGATFIDAKGAYTDADRYIVYMIVSNTEVKKAVKVIKQLDPKSFVSVQSLNQVYGNFHMKTVK